MITNCKQCGAPLRNGRCEYCGADYRKEIPQITYTIEPDYGYQTLACNVAMPLEIIYRDSKAAEQIVKKDMAYEMSKELLNYMDVETWIEPRTMTQMFGGRIRVKKPSF